MKSGQLSQIICAVSLGLCVVLGGQVDLGISVVDPSSMGPFGVFQEPAYCYVAHWLAVCGILLALLGTFYRTKVVQLPNPRIMGPMVLFFGTLVLSLFLSSFKYFSLYTLSEWLTYPFVLIACVAVGGRGQGLRTMLTGLLIGCSLVAIVGISEYGRMRGVDPNWRIFSTYVQPNALAAVMAVGLMLAMTLASGFTRIGVLLVSLAGSLCGFALYLTGSKGGIVSAVVGMVAYIVFTIAIVKKPKLSLMRSSIIFAGAAMLIGLLIVSNMGAAKDNRLAAAGSSAEQSVGFRSILWKSAVTTIKDHPMGYGIGTFRFEGSRTGMHPPTIQTHQAYLQLGVEGGVQSLALFIIFLGVLAFNVLRGCRHLDEKRATMFAGVVGAIAVVLAHGMVESVPYYFGIGVTLFALMGIAIQLAGDASTPELTLIHGRRWVAILSTSFAFVLLGYTAVIQIEKVDAAKSHSIGVVQSGDPGPTALRSLAPFDPVSWPVRLPLATTDNVSVMTHVTELSPTTGSFRELAQIYEELEPKMDQQALIALQKGLVRDPNNLAALLRILEIQIETKSPDGRATLDRILSVENSTYVKVRAIPEIVVTEGAEARIQFAKSELCPLADRERLLSEAVEIFEQYGKTTVPLVVRQGTSATGIGGETLMQAQLKLETGLEALRELDQLRKSAQDSTGQTPEDPRIAEFSQWLEAVRNEFDGSLRSSFK